MKARPDAAIFGLRPCNVLVKSWHSAVNAMKENREASEKYAARAARHRRLRTLPLISSTKSGCARPGTIVARASCRVSPFLKHRGSFRGALQLILLAWNLALPATLVLLRLFVCSSNNQLEMRASPRAGRSLVDPANSDFEYCMMDTWVRSGSPLFSRRPDHAR